MVQDNLLYQACLEGVKIGICVFNLNQMDYD